MVLEDNGIFVKCETDEVVYKFKTRNSKISEKSDSLIELFGKVVAKALMERIPIKMHLNRTILRQIAMKELKFCDFYNFDKDVLLVFFRNTPSGTIWWKTPKF